MRYKRILVTGGAGFIGSAFIRYGLRHFPLLEKIVNLDLLTYAGHEKNMEPFFHDPRHLFVRGDIKDRGLVKGLCKEYGIEAMLHCAAESHVDRSIQDPAIFLESNVRGTFELLEAARATNIRFHHVSTDEVYGSLEKGFFNELSPYQPNSPYAASKAASDHFVRAWGKTYGLPITISHCSNNYGPCQHVEKFIPQMIHNCLKKAPLPVYGEGINVRDWLYVEDHAEALWLILEKGKLGEVYTMGGETQMRNIDLLHYLIDRFAHRRSQDPAPLRKLITFVQDRQGHDFRYAIDCSKIKSELGWTQRHTLEEGLEKTLEWYTK